MLLHKKARNNLMEDSTASPPKTKRMMTMLPINYQLKKQTRKRMKRKKEGAADSFAI